ncbi:MAG: hypothetical protein ABSH20_09500 [Tepidisphaeraceae bacterium]|jgi:hypothetical protein
MANTDPKVPAGIDIPALRKQRTVSYNLMAGGPGTPWEDRDSLGYVPAFFKTCTKVMRDPETLFGLIRRLQYRTDARLFVIGVALLWFLSGMLHGGIDLYWLERSPLALAPSTAQHIEINAQAYLLGWAVFSLALAALVVGMMSLAAKFYYAMVSGGDMKGRGSPELVYNVLAYCLGTGILVLVPFIGPVVSLAWTLVLAIRAGTGRLRIGTRAAVISALMSFGVCLFIAVVLLWLASKGWGLFRDSAVMKFDAPRHL